MKMRTRLNGTWKALSRTFAVRTSAEISEFKGSAQPKGMPLTQIFEELSAHILAQA